MKIKHKVVAALILIFFSCVSVADESEIYLGLGTGVAMSSLSDSATDTTTVLRGSGLDFTLGYQPGRNVAIEMEFIDRRVNDSDDTVNMIFSGIGISAVGLIPVTNDFSFYGKIGKASINSTKPSFESKIGTSAGLGVQVRVSPKVKVRVSLDSYEVSAVTARYTGRVNMFGAGFFVNF